MTFPLKPLKHVATLNDDVLDERTSRNRLVRYAEVSDVAQGAPVRWKEPMKFAEVPSRARRITKHGDILVSTVRTYLRAVTQVIHPPAGAVASTGFAVVRPASGDSRYLGYALQGDGFIDEVVSRSVGVSYPAISSAEIARIRVPSPPCRAQRAIADYLDHETAEIDAFIADQELLADLAHEYEWSRLSSLLGYPERFSALWSRSDVGLVSLKHLGTITLGKMLDGAETTAGDETQPYLRAANVQPRGQLVLDNLKSMRFTKAERKRLTLRTGDVIIVEGGVGGYGRAAYLDRDLEGIGFQNSIVRFRPHSTVDGRYVAYALLLLRHMGYIEAVASVASMPHFTAEKVAEAPVPESIFANQRSTANKLDEVWERAGQLDDDLRRATNLARERRAALISAAVTGQIDVTDRHRPVAEVLEDEVREMV